MGFEEALMRIKEGWSVGRKVWGEGKVIRLQKGKYAIEGNEGPIDLSGIGEGMSKYYEPGGEIHRYPRFVIKRKEGEELVVKLGVEDMLAEDWYVGGKYMHFDCVGGWKDTEKVRETLEGVQVGLGKGGLGIGGQCVNKLEGDINGKGGKDYPDYVCIKDDEVSNVKRGTILRYDSREGMPREYYYYETINRGRFYVLRDDVKARYQCYQILEDTKYEVLDGWHVRFKAIEKVPDVKAVAYMVERLSEEEIKRTIDVNRNLINDCGENLAIGNDAKWQEFEIRVDGDVNKIEFENGAIRISISSLKANERVMFKFHKG